METKSDLKADVPKRLRIGLTLFVTADICLLLLSHLLVGATTQLAGHAPFGMLTPDTVSSDNLFSAIHRLANAKAWLMVLVVAVLSGCWPYLKLLITWAVVRRIHDGCVSKARGRAQLETLEALGKWSFADIFLICFNLVIFDISTPVYNIAIFFTLNINIWMQLHFAAFALLLAVTISTCLTHWAIFELSPPAPRWGSVSAEENVAISLESGAITQMDASTVSTSLRSRVCTVFACAFSSGCLVYGAFLPIVRVERGGFLGNLIGEGSELKLSIMSLVDYLSTASTARGDVIISFCNFTLVFVALVAPLVELSLLAAAAVMARISYAGHHWCRIGAEWFHSFDSVDVLLIVALATAFELSTVVQFNLGTTCDKFKPIMQNDVIMGIAGLSFAQDKSCFAAKSDIQPGWWILLVSVLMRSIAWRAGGAGPAISSS